MSEAVSRIVRLPSAAAWSVLNRYQRSRLACDGAGLSPPELPANVRDTVERIALGSHDDAPEAERMKAWASLNQAMALLRAENDRRIAMLPRPASEQ